METVTIPYIYYAPVMFAEGACGMNAEAEALTVFFLTDEEQRRPVMQCSEALRASAQHHANDMVNRGYFDHDTPEGVTPNERARQSGCDMPGYYVERGNNIESHALNKFDPKGAWELMLSSPSHKQHLLGLHSFFRDQSSYGIGYATSPWGTVWVIETAICKE